MPHKLSTAIFLSVEGNHVGAFSVIKLKFIHYFNVKKNLTLYLRIKLQKTIIPKNMKKISFSLLLIVLSVLGFSQKGSYDTKVNLAPSQKEKLDNADLSAYRFYTVDRTIKVDGIDVQLHSLKKMSSKGFRFTNNEVELSKTKESDYNKYPQKAIPSVKVGLNVPELEGEEVNKMIKRK